MFGNTNQVIQKFDTLVILSKMVIWTGWTGATSLFSYEFKLTSTCYSDRLHDFSGRCYKYLSVTTASFLTQLNSGILSTECFPLIHNLNGFELRIDRHFLTVSSFFSVLNRFPVCFNLVVLLFLVTPGPHHSGCSNLHGVKTK